MIELQDWILKIGKYYLSSFDETSLWISEQSGEGQEISQEAMEKFLDEFYKKNFQEGR